MVETRSLDTCIRVVHERKVQRMNKIYNGIKSYISRKNYLKKKLQEKRLRKNVVKKRKKNVKRRKKKLERKRKQKRERKKRKRKSEKEPKKKNLDFGFQEKKNRWMRFLENHYIQYLNF